MDKKTREEEFSEIGNVQPREVTEEMKASYIDYAMSVIISRALPDVRDGLKPVQRRILYTMYEDGLRHDAKFRKSATVVGSTLGRYHPHGDQAVYGAAVRMAQDFLMRYPLIQGQGNMGSVDDPTEYAAMRYTEMRLSKIGEEMLRDIEKKTVDFVPNYDGTRKEPKVLPSPLPQLLLNGSLGIAVGMATNIPPHNLNEVVDALVYLLYHPRATVEELFQYIQGPDFPTGGFIFDKNAILQAYSQGKGPILTRGRAEIVKNKKGGESIIIKEIPFQVQKSSFLAQIAKLVSEKRINGIRDVRDESDKEGMRIVIDLQRGTIAQKILNRLYKFSDLQKSFHLNMLALVDGIQPRVLNLVEVLDYFLKHRKEVVLRRTKYDLEKTKERVHILEGLAKCLGRIDEVIKTIKKSKDRKAAQENLMTKFKLDEIQANAILETKLASLAKLEREKIENELKEKRALMKELEAILKSPRKVKALMKKELEELKEKFGDERKTTVVKGGVKKISEEDLIPEQETIVTLTRGGYIKRISPKNYKIQKRGGKGILGIKTIGDDVVEHFLVANTHDDLLFFTDSGKVFKTKVYEIPEGQRLAKGRGVANFLEISSEEKVLSLIPLSKGEENIEYLTMITRKGRIKKTPLEDFANVRRKGLIAILLKRGDLLKKVIKSTGEDEIMIVTKKGQSIRFKEKDIRPMGRTAAGVKGISLKKGDEVIAMDVIKKLKGEEKKKKRYLLVLTEKGYGKRTPIKEYRIQRRGGQGIKTAKITLKTGTLVASKVLDGEEELIVISQRGQVVRIKIGEISILSRATQGVRIMRLEEGDKIASAAFM